QAAGAQRVHEVVERDGVRYEGRRAHHGLDGGGGALVEGDGEAVADVGDARDLVLVVQHREAGVPGDAGELEQLGHRVADLERVHATAGDHRVVRAPVAEIGRAHV